MASALEGIRPLARFAAERMGIPRQEIESFIAEYMDLQVLYRSAIREVSSRFENLDDEFQFRHKRNPIHHIQTRLKTPNSMLEKMTRRGIKPSAEALRTELTDIAGVRVICSYVDDIYYLADLLTAQDGVKLLRLSDYIKTPKANGYRSLHIVISVPVQLSDEVSEVPVEIQIRTIAMDFWASLEHELRYKAIAEVDADIVRELRDCAEDIALLDERMQRVYHRLEDMEETQEPPKNGQPPQKGSDEQCQ